MRNKTYKNAKNYSNQSKHLVHDRDNTPIILGGATMGSMDIDNIYDEVEVNNLEDLLEDLTIISTCTIGDIKIKNENVSPSGFSQIDRWEFVADNSYIYTEDTIINILGRKTLMRNGDNLVSLVQKVVDVVEAYIMENKYFSSVNIINNTTIEIEYNDRRNHSPTISNDEMRFSMNQSIVREPVYGYGQWVYLGTEKKTLGETVRNLYYFERVG